MQAVALAVVLGWAAVVLLGDDPAPQPQPVSATWTYIVDEQDIEQVTFHSGDTHTVYRKVIDGWVIDHADGPIAVDAQRWSTEVLVLLGGPAASRVFTVSDGQFAVYGLEPPRLEVEMMLRGNRILQVFVGSVTPDGTNHYVRVDGRSDVALIPASWANFLNLQLQ